MIFASLHAWRERRRAMREVSAMKKREDAAAFLSNAHPFHLAKAALLSGDRAEALRLWQQARLRYTEQAESSHDALDFLLELGRIDEAEALMLKGRRKAPRERYYAEGYAIVAEQRHDWPEAIRRWTASLKQFPGPQGHAHMATCLVAVGRVDEAEKMLQSTVSSYPGVVNVCVAYAKSAESLCKWSDGLERWETVSQRFKVPFSVVGEARCLAALGRSDEAEARLVAARSRYPIASDIPIALAMLAETRNDEAAAVRWWALVRERFPLIQRGYVEGIRVLRTAQRLDDADAVAHEATERFSGEPWAFIEYATVAGLKQDWGEAVRRWEAVRQRWPDRRVGYMRGADALAASGQKPEAEQLRAMWRGIEAKTTQAASIRPSTLAATMPERSDKH